MRFVPVKTIEQQAALMLHRSSDLLVRQRTQLINALRAHLAEIGLVAATGVDGLQSLLAIVRNAGETGLLPAAMLQALVVLVDQLAALQMQIGKLEASIHAQHRASDASRRLETIPGIGVIGATAIAATVTDASAFGVFSPHGRSSRASVRMNPVLVLPAPGSSTGQRVSSQNSFGEPFKFCSRYACSGESSAPATPTQCANVERSIFTLERANCCDWR